jgi:flavodoxin
MEIKQVNLIYFSPTGTTQKVLASIAKGIAPETVKHINVTPPRLSRMNSYL